MIKGQPTAVLWSEAKIQATDELVSFVGGKGFVESSHGVRIQIVADQNHFLCIRVSRAEKFFHLNSPIDLGALLANMHRAPAGKWFGEHENAGGCVRIRSQHGVDAVYWQRSGREFP